MPTSWIIVKIFQYVQLTIITVTPSKVAVTLNLLYKNKITNKRYPEAKKMRIFNFFILINYTKLNY